MKKIYIITLILFLTKLSAISQVTSDSLFRELKRQKVKYPELFTVLAISESGIGTYDEDTFLIKINNYWSFGYDKYCGCKNKEGFASYDDVSKSVIDLKERFALTLRRVKNENELVKYFCYYYVGVTPNSTRGSLWVKRLLTIYNDSFFE